MVICYNSYNSHRKLILSSQTCGIWGLYAKKPWTELMSEVLKQYGLRAPFLPSSWYLLPLLLSFTLYKLPQQGKKVRKYLYGRVMVVGMRVGRGYFQVYISPTAPKWVSSPCIHIYPFKERFWLVFLGQVPNVWANRYVQEWGSVLWLTDSLESCGMWVGKTGRWAQDVILRKRMKGM